MSFLQQLFFPAIMSYLVDKTRLSKTFEKMSETGMMVLIADAREFVDYLEAKEWNLAAVKVAMILSRIK